MILVQHLYAPSGNGDVSSVRDLLMRDFGLVPPKHPLLEDTKDRVVVWEDPDSIGRFRVTFYPKSKIQYAGNATFDRIRFAYWLNNRLNEKILKQDPMKLALAASIDAIDSVIWEYVPYNVYGDPQTHFKIAHELYTEEEKLERVNQLREERLREAEKRGAWRILDREDFRTP